MLRLLTLPLAIALAALVLAGLASAQAPKADELPDLKGEIDFSIRWLRSTQNPETGAYGGDLEGTAWVLFALARSPRKYERPDGPFVSRALDYLLSLQREDGSFVDADRPEGAALATTRAAAAALSVHIDDRSVAPLGKALKYLASNGVDAPSLEQIAVPVDEPGATRLAFKLLGDRADEGSWSGPRGKVTETARGIEALTRIRSQVAPPAAAPGTPSPLPRYSPATRVDIDEAVLRGARFLIAAGEDARWGAPGEPDAGLTAMVTSALLEVPEPRPADIQAAIDDALGWLVTHQKANGSIHQGRLANYVTSASIMALSSEPKYAEQVLRARNWLIGLQADEGEGYSEGDLYYGGIGYGGDERPDLSNLQMSLEALAASGLSRDDAAFQRALKFLERCQNRSETNDVELTRKGIVIKSGDDGGAGYAPGDSKAGFVQLPDGTKVPRSYGSMTYALLKSFVFAGLSQDDPRVEACWKWLCDNYTLDVNPGFAPGGDPVAPYQGLYYYFHTMAKALDVYGVDQVVDGAGVTHDWRAELAGRLLSLQDRGNGSWANRNAPRWWEGNPVLATSYALLSLGAARK